MILFARLILSLAITQLAAAKDDRQATAGHTFFLSHLSPLLNYTPSTGWDTSLYRQYTTDPNASLEFEYFGSSFSILEGNYSSLVAPGRYDTEIDWKEASIKTNGSEDSFMSIRSVLVSSNVPATSWETRGTAEHISATNNTDFYRDDAGAWAVMEPPTNQSTGVQFSWAWDEPPSYTADYPYNSTVSSTDQVGQPLRFSVPPYTSIMQLYGSVGPNQGRYELRLIPTSEGDIQFQPHSLNQSHTGQRDIDAIYETKAIAWLDPRATYDVEIELQEEGKRTDLHGVSFWRYTEVGAEIQDWWSEPSSRLSGGQIAGIVVGSVAGAVLLGLGIWWFMRRRNRQKRTAGLRKLPDDA